MARRVKKPNKGDKILHIEAAFKRETEGRVVSLLADQFSYVTQGIVRYCMYNEDWKVTKAKKLRSKKK